MGICSAELNEFIDVNPKDHTVNMKKQWYENTEWNNVISNAFEAKLSRSKISKNPQYLIAQANALKGKWTTISKELTK